MRFELKGLAELHRKFDLLGKNTTEEISKALKLSAIDIQKDIVDSIRKGGRGGKTYMKGKNKNIRHTASAPGEPPATDTGNLVRNTTVETVDATQVTVGYRQDAPYGAALEFGFRKGNRHIEARPALQPALEKNEDNIKNRIDDAIKKSIKRSGQ